MRRAVIGQHGKGLYFIFTQGQVLNVGIGDVIGPHACRGDAQAAQRPWTCGNARGLEHRFAGIIIADGQCAGIAQGRCRIILGDRTHRIARDNRRIVRAGDEDKYWYLSAIGCCENVSIRS